MLPATICVLGCTIIGFTITFWIVMLFAIKRESSPSYRRPQTARPPKRVCKYTEPCWPTEDMRRFRNDIGDYLVRKYYEDLRKEQEKQLYDSMLEELRKK